MSKLSRAIKFIMAIWIVAFCLAIPQAIQFGVVTIYGGRSCTVNIPSTHHMYLYFALSMYCILYVYTTNTYSYDILCVPFIRVAGIPFLRMPLIHIILATYYNAETNII